MEQLTPAEVKAWQAIQAAKFPKAWGMGIIEIMENPDPIKIKELIKELMQQHNDNPGMMLEILGFDLPFIMGVTYMNLTEINFYLSINGCPFCAKKHIDVTRFDGEYCGKMQEFEIKGMQAVAHVDVFLTRYLHISNGQLLECTNDDLVRMPVKTQMNLRDYLTR